MQEAYHGQKRRSAALLKKGRYWQQHIDGWQASGVTQSEYCRRYDLKYSRFVYSLRKLNRVRTATLPPAIVELPITAGFSGIIGSRQHPVFLTVGSKYRIEVGRDFDPVALGQRLDMLGCL